MDTHEQRKEVAEKLRQEASRHEILFLRFFSTVLIDAIELNYKKPSSFNDVLICLAELIDPTCEDLYSDDKTHAWQFKCSSCGSTLDCMDDNGESTIQLDGVAQGVSYCPHCGARVVEE
ncbi:hypothetical protein IV72_GL000556 [Atopobium minutum]|uniref:Uncharacterized protein n=1 Tax=Atopobium minutum TaxID=1381 RepID=A0AB38A4V6_9ACTN|nr:hypothetical protein [Atopobium minutum]KRN55057.1 hypothetical protein IV72_GL000556 [Atopobium minutum]SEB44059.1 hypothetical protein SAMN04489746_0230 [Atopobium minutum]